MTDDLITRLRAAVPSIYDCIDAADALKAKDRRIEELEKMLALSLAVDVDALKARIAELEAENRALRNEYKAVNQELTEMQGKYQTTRAALGEKN